jgi:CHAT domain-containing protein
MTIPALALLPRLQRRPKHKTNNVLVAGNPTGDLRYAEDEAREVANILGAEPLIGAPATRAAVIERISEASIVHLAAHAHFNPDSPLDSAISLSDGELTAREVIRQRLHADLLVLSACQTGMVGPLGGDELAGLALAYLQAGVRSLLVSLWSVDDPATATLMTAYYAAGGAAGDKAEALSKASFQVKSEGKWSHPYYWGAFVLLGAP